MFDSLSVASILDNQDAAQALADGLVELSKEGSVSVVAERQKPEEISAQINPKFMVVIIYQFIVLGQSSSEKSRQFIKVGSERFWSQDVVY